MKRLLLSLFLAGIAITAYSQTESFNCYLADAGAAIRNHNCNFISLDLTVQLFPEEGKVSGTAVYQFQPIQVAVDSVFLDGPGILVQHMEVDHQQAKYRVDSAGITVFFNPPLIRNSDHELLIQYDAYPKRGIYFNGWKNDVTDDPNDPTIIRKQIWTQGQGIDNRNWIPSYDDTNDKLISALHITFDADYTVISNGDLTDKKINADHTITWSYAMPHPHALYLIMLAVGKYDHLDFTSKNGITSREYYYPGTAATAALTYDHAAEMMDFIESETGLHFPWTTYANVPVQEFLYGAMENTTATIYSDYFYQDAHTFPDKNYVDINAHELTHQWFGDYVTAWSEPSHWMQESFATYYSKKFRESIDGEDVYQWKRRDEMNTALDADNKNNFPIAHSQAGSQRVYQKGSFVLDMMRYILGDEQFKIVIKDYLMAHPYGNIEARDLELQCMQSLGINMHWFFDEWIYRGGFPEYTVTHQSAPNGEQVTVRQTQQQNETVHLFSMPIHIQVHYTDGSFDDKLVTIEKDSTAVLFPSSEGKEVAFVLFDPNTMVYSKVNFSKPYSEIKYQMFNAPNMMDRYDALVLLRDIDLATKRNDLIQLYDRQNFWGIKSEILSQLGGDEDKSTIKLFEKAFADADPLVRRAALSAFPAIPDKLRKEAETMLSDFNYSNIELALFRLTDQFPDNKQKYLAATSGLKGTNNNIRITWLSIAGIDDPKQLPELVHFTSSDYEFRTRNYAISAVMKMNYCDNTLIVNLFDAALSTNNRLAGPARNALIKLKENPANALLILHYYQANAWDDWQTRKLSPVMADKQSSH